MVAILLNSVFKLGFIYLRLANFRDFSILVIKLFISIYGAIIVLLPTLITQKNNE